MDRIRTRVPDRTSLHIFLLQNVIVLVHDHRGEVKGTRADRGSVQELSSICFEDPRRERPTKFSPSGGSESLYIILPPCCLLLSSVQRTLRGRIVQSVPGTELLV